MPIERNSQLLLSQSNPAGNPTILITGAAGNLGSLLARHLRSHDVRLRLMVHKTPLPEDLKKDDDPVEVKADLADKASLRPAVADADVIVHFAGVLFAPRPAKFLPETNVRWFSNLLECAER